MILTCDKCKKETIKTVHPYGNYKFCMECIEIISPIVKKKIEEILSDFIKKHENKIKY